MISYGKGFQPANTQNSSMSLQKRWVVGIPVLVTLSIFVFFSLVSSDIKIESEFEKKDRMAPQLEFKLPDGSASNLESLRGTALLLNFWATWCNPCLEEMPSLRALEEHFPSNLKVLAINIQETPRAELEDKIQGIVLPRNLIFNVKRSQIAQYKLEGLPYSIFVNREGIPVKTYEGPRNWDSPEILKEIKELLK